VSASTSGSSLADADDTKHRAAQHTTTANRMLHHLCVSVCVCVCVCACVSCRAAGKEEALSSADNY
jgi:hypothetical protein